MKGLLAVAAVLAAWAVVPARAQTVTVSAQPSAVTFTWQQGTARPAAQTISMRASSGTPAYTAVVSSTNSLWLALGGDVGNLPGKLTLSANPTSLGEGTYTASITVTTATTAPLNITVTLIVTPPPPTLTLSSTTAAFVSPPSPPPSQTVFLSTSGAPVSFTAAASGAQWLSVTPATGIVLPGGKVALTLTANPAGLAPAAKAYTGKVVVTAAGVPASNKTQTINVTLTVNSTAPTITALWPSTVQVNTGPITLTIYGTGFYAATTATFGATPLATTVLSGTAMLATVPANLLAAAGAFPITVTNPAPGGSSAPVNFTVSASATISAAVNAASYEGNSPASPGELLTLFGTGIGPATAVYMADSDADGYIDTTAASLQVTIDGVAAPIIYGDANQVTVQVPYTASQGANKAISVSNGGTTPATGTITIQAAAPGIFTANGSGTGPAAALVYPAGGGAVVVNGPSSPAHAGDALSLFLTGEGDYLTTPVQHTGYVVPTGTNPLPQMSPLPVVTIGGAAATVTYAGPVPGSMVGLLQINCTVPTGFSPAGSSPVVVTIGGVATQSNVTVYTK